MTVDINQDIEECLSLVERPRRDLCNHRAGCHSILVAYKVTDHISVTFLASGYEGFDPFQFQYLGTDKLESGKNVVYFYSGTGCDVGRQFAGHDCLHHKLIAIEHFLLLPLLHDVVEKHAHGLVAVEEHPFAIRSFDCHSHSVGIGVGSKNDIGIYLLSQLDGHLHSSLLLGIGAGGGGEIAIGDGLRLNHVHIGKSQLLQHTRNKGNTCAMKGCVDYLHIVMAEYCIGIKGVFFDPGQIDFVDLFAYGDDIFLASGHSDIRNGLYLKHLVDDCRIVGSGKLAPVAPVCLIAIVLLGVVACC